MNEFERSFIEKATLLFIASRSDEGAMDVSPRGGQPSVVRISADGSLLLPDYVGNKRLDTIGNILSNPNVTLVLLNKQTDAYLHIVAHATFSQREEDIAAFPADENRPLSILVLKPSRMDIIRSDVFRKSGFWLDPAERKRPLDVLDIYARDRKWQTENGNEPVIRDAESEHRLAEAGLREFYGTPSPIVQTKAYNVAGPGFMSFIDHAGFVVFAYETETGEILIELFGGKPLRVNYTTNRQSFLLDMNGCRTNQAKTIPHSGKYALLAAEPGRCENIRLNGDYRGTTNNVDEQRVLSLSTEEIYFHCSSAFTRSRIWTDVPPTAWTGKRRFLCAERKRESHDVTSFILKPRDSAPIGDVLPGQYVTVSLLKDDHRIARQRCYSISGTPETYSLRITVRRIGNNGVSDLLHDEMQIGDELLLGPPAGHFVLESSLSRPIVFISAGVGITPLMPMVEKLSKAQPGREAWFLHAARSREHHLFKEDIERIADINPSLRLFTAYSKPNKGDNCDHSGRLNAGIIGQLLPVAEADFYICGPNAFMSEISEGLKALGARPDGIKTEAFEQKSGCPTMLASKTLVNRAPCSVMFARSGQKLTWKQDSGTLLDLALAHEIDVPFSCRTGECQSCVQRIVEGKVDYLIGEEPILARGRVMLCQATPLGDVVIDC
ncbi:pyridoxamine 5'-phosphate oxidase family protein [Ochrobactrum sp. Marseille-Q0166]|uniref:2Fe-2S iron-sulfur cluster-binding protein n=1 Tax=Ochrobactrum sp. Marseille-Q0166 TaxID=2761105 RepID=UPI001655403B|nr:pyridoxamine 5'-phosphate oxidase family protein [Ochrobactrum sp. Marseille-Q0166]MBC8719651.1 2Fe-2S iron-sulfur cluster binding domain-containing protein [Ochrobactrum sp. Marseille-Q0166]